MLTELDKGWMQGEWMQGEYLLFKDEGKCAAYQAKTRVFSVISRKSLVCIGSIRWYASWRRYTLCPIEGTVFDAGCLRDIADFCELKTSEHKSDWKTQN